MPDSSTCYARERASFLKVLALKFQIPTGGGLMLLFLDGVDEREAACSFLVVVAAHVLEGAAA
jgi:hypothetical protein